MADKKPVSKPAEFVDVDTFIASASPVYHVSKLQQAGFKSLMLSEGKSKMAGIESYVPYLKQYLDKK